MKTPPQFQSRSFKALQRKWYGILKQKGFRDIEHNDYALTEYHSRLQNDYSPQHYLEKERYYQLASQLLHELKFQSPLHKKVWTLHAQGLPARAIARRCELKSPRSAEWIIKTIAKHIKL